MPAETRGHRFYLVRLAHGDGARRAESLKAFSERVYRETGVRIHPSELSEIETDKPSKAVTLEHVEAVAAVDKMKRGKLWLGWGEQEQQRTPLASYQIPNPIASALAGEPPAPEPVEEPAPKPERLPRKNARGKR